MHIRRIYYTSNFARKVRKLPKGLKNEIKKREEIFRNDPFNPLLKTHKLKGQLKDFWAFSLTYSHRVLFEFTKKDEVLFYDVGDHRIYE